MSPAAISILDIGIPHYLPIRWYTGTVVTVICR